MEKGSSGKRPLAIWIAIGIGAFLLGCWLLIGTFVIAVYNVPTGAMEKSIRLRSKILVQKLSYRPISRGDILVFHFPAGDTVIDLPEYQSMRPYYDVIRALGNGNPDAGRQIVLGNPDQYPLSIRPVYRREPYLKRCIATPGDWLEMRDEEVYINGHPLARPAQSQTYYRVVTNGQPLNEGELKAKYDLDVTKPEEIHVLNTPGEYEMLLTASARTKMLKDGFARQVTADIDTTTRGIFPNDEAHPWTIDNFGPLWIPAKGATIQLTPLNYPVYERIIRTYEDNKLQMREGKIYVNGRQANSYTFKMNYYWVIGDNLHESQDSRFWGFVPEDHLIGKVWAKL
jgi:signal peptidase I